MIHVLFKIKLFQQIVMKACSVFARVFTRNYSRLFELYLNPRSLDRITSNDSLKALRTHEFESAESYIIVPRNRKIQLSLKTSTKTINMKFTYIFFIIAAIVLMLVSTGLLVYTIR